MKIFYPIIAITNEKIEKLLQDEPSRDLHLIVYQLCHLVAARYRQLDTQDAACECYIKIMSKLDYIRSAENKKSYIESMAHKHCLNMIEKKDNRKRIENGIRDKAMKIIEYHVRYGK